jgi:hypothetical protein
MSYLSIDLVVFAVLGGHVQRLEMKLLGLIWGQQTPAWP